MVCCSCSKLIERVQPVSIQIVSALARYLLWKQHFTIATVVWHLRTRSRLVSMNLVYIIPRPSQASFGTGVDWTRNTYATRVGTEA